MFDKVMSIVLRTIFGVAVLMLAIAVWDWILRVFDLTLSWVPYTPAELLQFSVTLIIFLIPMLLREIREAVKGKA